MQSLGQQAVAAAYQSLDPWKALKLAANSKIRLVMPHELKEAKLGSKPDKQLSGEDPWTTGGDPWQSYRPKIEARRAKPMAIALVPGHFVNQKGDALPVLEHLTTDVEGVSLLEEEEVQSLAGPGILLSAGCLAAIVITAQCPRVGTLVTKAITFPAVHEDNKVLLRGFAVNFGQQPVCVANAKHCIDLDVADVSVVTLELRKECLMDWHTACKNPLKYSYTVVEGLQRAAVSTWSRKFFSGRKEVSKEEATSWHAFAKIHALQLEPILACSGKGGVFITPKDQLVGASSGRFRVVWLENNDIEKAIKLHRMHPELLGVVRGKSSLGLRTRASEYSTVRKKLDPTWNPEGILTHIVVARRWVLAPLPVQADKKLLQQMANQLGWKATPLKQISATSWLLGSGIDDVPGVDTFQFSGAPVLITEQLPKKQLAKSEVVAAAPATLKRSVETHFAKRLPINHASSPSDVVMTAQSQPTRCLLSELKEELNERLQDLQLQMQTAVNAVNQRVAETEANAMEQHAINLKNDQKLDQLQQSVQAVVASTVTKTDLADALKNLRHLFQQTKRSSPDVSPRNEGKAARTG